mgnify:CR=1 FL=1
MSDSSILPTISRLNGSNPNEQAEAWYQVYCAAQNLAACLRQLPIHARDYPGGAGWANLIHTVEAWEGSATDCQRQACNFYLHWDAQVQERGQS